MPSFSNYKKMLGVHTNGEIRKNQSDMIMDATWWEDINSRVAYLYDYYHDDYKTQLNNLDSSNDKKKVPIDIKYLQSSSQTYDKDSVTFHIQLRPGQECNVNYYNEFFTNRYQATFPIGLYIDIPDERGIFNRWLVVDKANYNVTQFPTFEVLRCDKVIQYIFDNVKYNVPAVLRSQNSYNSGIWTDYKISTVEDQQKFAVPLNRDTEHLFYNQRIIIDSTVLTEPRAWKISKVNRISPNGISRITLAQDVFDQHKDYIELDNVGNVIGMWANYYNDKILPEDYEESKEETNMNIQLTYAGTKPELKIGGSYKTFTAKLFDGEEEIPITDPGTWYYLIDGYDVSSLIDSIDNGLGKNKIKFIGDLSYIGSVITIKYVSFDGYENSVDMEIKRL